MIISRTPYRISFFGGGTDYPAWYESYGGEVLGTTIDKYCYLTCRYLPPFFEHRIRVVYSRIEHCQHLDEIQHPAVREVLRYLQITRGLEIHHDGDLPARSGMGSSSSFIVGLLHALYGLKGDMSNPGKLASEGTFVEQTLLKETVGSQDQILAAYGGFRHLTFKTSGEMCVEPLILPMARLKELNEHLALYYTGVSRTASDIAGTYVSDINRKAKSLLAMKDMVQEGMDILASGKDISLFGNLLHQAWEEKKSMGNLVSNDDVDDIYSRARSAGAIGGKLLGAGGGGFMLLFVPPEARSKVDAELNYLVKVPFKFESSGSQIILYDPEEDYSAEDEARLQQRTRAFINGPD